ncbi:uncharacterized protein BT62DRAFT_923288 [Guyanagaster necrorhizus]|uniref:Uncharacterized protein n=1 Tax=Guyanagaster necrorhizus TaxID=856835 RepID=A0A9P7VJ13_9AGAR|nr:uncharacterized protein BT62DRAFT_923288 [Guyanagaster necrorhizus MCA 3950]KAG7441512.1 hypothetical protein BT62DRAFT_923288 [Guyanagaster necrorhizus MCA 3950]
MVGFLRKKSTNKQAQPSPTPSGPISIGGPTPLYAKFASVTTNGKRTGSEGKRKQTTNSREERDSATSLLPIQPVPSSSGDHAPIPAGVFSSSPQVSAPPTNRRLSRGGAGGGGGAPRLETLIPSEALFSTPKALTRSTADNQDGSGESGRQHQVPGSLQAAKGITHELASDPVPPSVLHRSVSSNEPKPLLDETSPPLPEKPTHYAAPVSYAMNGAYPMPVKKSPHPAAPAPVASRKGPLIFAAMVQPEDSYPSPPADSSLDPVPRFITRGPVSVAPKPTFRETVPQFMPPSKAQSGRTQTPTTNHSPSLPAHSTSRMLPHSPPQTPPQHIPQQFGSPPPSQYGSSSHQVPQSRPDTRPVPVEPPTPQSVHRQNVNHAAPPVAYHHQPNSMARSSSNGRPNGSVNGHGIGVSRAPSQIHPNGNVDVNRALSNARQLPKSQPPNLYPNGAARPSTSNGVVRMPSLTNMNATSGVNGRQAYPYPNGIIRSPSQTHLPNSVTSRTAAVLRSPSQTQVHIIPSTPSRAAPSRSPSDASVSHSTRRLMKRYHHQQPSATPAHDDVPYFADDPFAKVEGVKVLPASSVTHGSGEDVARERMSSREGSSRGVSLVVHSREGSREEEKAKAKVEEEEDVDGDGVAVPRENVLVRSITPEKRRVKTPSPPPPLMKRSVTPPQKPLTPPPPPAEERPATPPPPVTPRSRSRHYAGASPPPDSLVANVKVNEDQPFPLHTFLADPALLRNLLGYLGWWEWCVLGMVSQRVRNVLFESGPEGDERREEVLERFLGGVGYRRWAWPDDPEPVRLTVNALHAYMHGVSLPTHEYARIAVRERDPELGRLVKALERATRAFTSVVLRLRAQAEKEATMTSPMNNRPPSPTFSTWSHAQSHAGHVAPTPSNVFRSPLVKLRRAPLLRCFVPSPDGDWLSDTSVLRCEAEMDKAGVRGLLRAGDVVWDVAVGDEANLGRMVWDGRYLIDLDYTYSLTVRGGNNGSGGGPVIRVDLRPWGEEIRGNMQLLQDRVRTETPQGTYHNVVRWVHRSSFQLRARRGTRIPIPESNGLFVDPGWYGTVVVETEGTNESLRDLQERLGIGRGIQSASMRAKGADSSWRDDKMVFRILRERSRPGEIWIRAVGVKERDRPQLQDNYQYRD